MSRTAPLPEVCYALSELEMADPSFTVTTPIIIKRGEIGYYLTDWVWSKAHAVEALNQKNRALGIDPETAARMQGYSMFGWPEKEAA